MKTVYIFINGILTFPGGAGNWTGRAVTHTILNTPHAAEKVEYLSFATIHRLLGQHGRKKKLARVISFYERAGWTIHLVAHSNGGDVVFDALRYLNFPRIATITLFSPACGNDFARLGVRAAQLSGAIGAVRIYIANNDGPLRLAGSWLGALFGYGKLGRVGPVNHVPERTTVIRRDDWGHSEWWLDQNFPWTMEQILKAN